MDKNVCYLRVGPFKFKCTDRQSGVVIDTLMGMGGTSFVLSWITYRPMAALVLIVTIGYFFMTRRRPECIFDAYGNGATFTYEVCAFCHSIIQSCIILIALYFIQHLFI